MGDAHSNEASHWDYETLSPPRGEIQKEVEAPKAEVNELRGDSWQLGNSIDYTGGETNSLVFNHSADSTDGST